MARTDISRTFKIKQFLTIPSLACVLLCLCIIPITSAMGQEKEDAAQHISYLPSFSRWCELNTPEEFADQEQADIEYTSHLQRVAEQAHPYYHFASFNTYVQMRSAYSDGQNEIDPERWGGQTSVELYKNFLEHQIKYAQKQKLRARIALKIIPGHQTFELNLLNDDTWDSFQEKVAMQTGLPAAFQKIQIGGTGSSSSLEDIIAWVDSGKCVLVIDAQQQQ